MLSKNPILRENQLRNLEKGIPFRKLKGCDPITPRKNIKEYLLKNLYINKKLSIKEISKLLECGEGTIENYLKLYNIPRRSQGFQKGNKFYKIRKHWLKGTKGKSPMTGIKGINHPSWKHGKPKCIDCRKELSSYNAKRCPKCKYKFFSGENNWNWNGGTSFLPYTIEYYKIRDMIKKRDNFTCRLCGFKPKKEKNYFIQVHHIDHDKKNNNPDNLISLCKKCNSKVNYNKEYWTNYFKNMVISNEIMLIN